MTLTCEGKRWIARTSYEERAIPKAAGMRWDPDEKVWWTEIPDIALRLVKYADKACRADLERMAAARQEAFKGSRAVDADIDIPSPDGLVYRPYQRASVKYSLARPGTLLGDEMGTGKTIEAIGVINADPAVKRVLVITPASLKLNWKRELERWLVRPSPGKASTRARPGRPTRRPMSVGIAAPDSWPDTNIVIVNYDVVHRFVNEIHAVTWDVLIADEAHLLKNPKARRTAATVGGKH